MDRGAWRATYSPWGRQESDTTERLSAADSISTPSFTGLGWGGGGSYIVTAGHSLYLLTGELHGAPVNSPSL